MKLAPDLQEQKRRIAQSEADKAAKGLQRQIDSLRAELDELREIVKELLNDDK